MRNEKLKKYINRTISGVIAVLMCLILFPNISSTAEETKKIFTYSNYAIEYNVVNAWGNSQNIEIKLTNTGSETIYNWALGFNADGEISGIWNGIVFRRNGTNYIIKNSGYNYEILPGSSITFGYTLNGDKLDIPDDFELCSERNVINDNYSTKLVLEDRWENGFSGYIELINESNADLEAWMLSFESNFIISDIWNAQVINKEDFKYKVSSQIMNNPILADSSVKIGIKADLGADVEPLISNTVVSVVQINEDCLNKKQEIIIDDSDDNTGKMYFKDISDADDIVCDLNGDRYFKNQILATACDNVSFEAMESLVHSMNAEIVGYIELTNDYQIEFNYDLSVEELFNISDKLSENPDIEFSAPNIIFESVCNSLPDDKEIQAIGTNNKIKINSNNANIYAIKAPDAWDYFMHPELGIATNTVKIGVIDTDFYTEHEDLHFVKTWNNPQFIRNTHGTLVAGVIGADFNNGIGIAGLCPKAEMYGYAFNARENEDINKMNNIMHLKYALALNIGNHTRVINISMAPCENLKLGTRTIDIFLNKLLNKGYDFVIVNSAGNDAKDAKSNSYFANIDKSSSAYSHIIVVGAAEHQSEIKIDPDTHQPITPTPQPKTDENGNQTLEYEYKSNSNYGERVDIVAPGTYILSTSNEKGSYSNIDDTSAAAPQVSGVAGMIYSIKPDLKGNEVKNIIINSAKESAAADSKRKINGHGYEYALLDAKAAVDMTIKLNGPFIPTFEKDEAIVFGVITDINDEPIKNAKIKLAYNTSTAKDVLYFETDENGEYFITLKLDTYDLKFSTGTFKGWIWGDYAYHLFTGKKIAIDEDGFNNAYPLDIKLDNKTTQSVGIYDDSNGMSISNVTAEITDENDNSQTIILQDGELTYDDVDKGKYTICMSKKGYIPKTIQVNSVDGVIYDETGTILNKITLVPVEVSIYGKVTIKNKTTNQVEPKSGHTVRLFKDGSVFSYVSTQANGTYRFDLNEYGDYLLVFNDEHKSEININTNSEYEINCELEYEKDENNDSQNDENDNDTNDDNTNDNDTEDKDGDSWTETIEDEFVISTKVDDPSQDASNDNINVIGIHNVDLKKGLYIDCGEYTYRYYVADYESKSAEVWTAFYNNLLMYDVYKNGELIDSRRVCFWYKRVVLSSNYNVWIYTEYVSSVGVKIIEVNGKSKLYLTYTLYSAGNPNIGGPDSSNDHKIYLTECSNATPTIRNY